MRDSGPIDYLVASSTQLYWGIEHGNVSFRGTHHPGWCLSWKLEIAKKERKKLEFQWNLEGEIRHLEFGIWTNWNLKDYLRHWSYKRMLHTEQYIGLVFSQKSGMIDSIDPRVNVTILPCHSHRMLIRVWRMVVRFISTTNAIVRELIMTQVTQWMEGLEQWIAWPDSGCQLTPYILTSEKHSILYSFSACLLRHGITGILLQWIESFMTGQYIVIVGYAVKLHY